MRLVRVSIEGYRSIKERLEVTLDPHVTVLLGANDHGKTNFLQALRHLNHAEGFEADDLNWDHAERADSLPALRFEMELAEPEQATLARLDSASRLATSAGALREEALSSWREAKERLQEAEGQFAEQKAEVEAAASAAKQVAEARIANPDDQDIRNEEVPATARVASGQVEQERLRGIVEAHKIDVNDHALSFAIAEGRAIEAEALKEGQETESAVEKAASEQEALAETRRRSMKRAVAKLKSAQNAVEELPGDVEEGKRKQAEGDLSAAQVEETKARSESEEQAAKATRLRAPPRRLPESRLRIPQP
ncbi:MAG TPA: AAA family ATPase [Solirubrobacterales bacterium]